MTAQQVRASVLTDRLGTLAAEIAPHRLTGVPVADDVQAAWRASAELAAAAAALNAEVTALARARQGALLTRLAQAREGRRALTAYRPRGHTRTITEQRV